MFKERWKEVRRVLILILLLVIIVAVGTAIGIGLLSLGNYLLGESIMILIGKILGFTLLFGFIVLIGGFVLHDLYKYLKTFIFWLIIEPYKHSKEMKKNG